MALTCPSCEAEVRGEAVDVACDEATCPQREHVFIASKALAPDNARQVSHESRIPPSETVFVQHTPDGGISMLLPKRGLGKRSLSLFLFAVFWDVLTIGGSVLFLAAIVAGE